MVEIFILQIFLKNFFFSKNRSSFCVLFLNHSYQNKCTQVFGNATKSLSDKVLEKLDGKVTTYIFENKCYFSTFFLMFILRYVKKCSILRMSLLLCSIYVFNFYQDIVWMLQFTDRFRSLNHQAYCSTWNNSFTCTGQLIAAIPIRAVKIPSVVVTRLSF